MSREGQVPERVSNGQSKLTLALGDPAATVRPNLTGFTERSSERIRSVVEEFARYLAMDDGVLVSLGVAAIDDAQLTRLVADWIDRILADSGDALGEVPRLTGKLGAILLTPTHQRCVTSGLARTRRRLVEQCLCIASEIGGTQPGLVDAVACAFDLEIQSILEVNQREQVGRLVTAERLAEMGQLVASVGHEMRNSLGAIETSAYLLSQQLEHLAATESGVAKHLSKIRRHVQQASKTAFSLLELAKRKPPRCAPVGILALLGDVLEELERPKGVNVEVAVSESLQVWGDRDQLRVVLVNLLSNAVQALGTCGKIRVESLSGEPGTTLLVADDGPGIPLSEQSRIFELLRTTKRDGTGLGLPLCQRIVAAHGGSLTLQPSEQGAVFRLWFPDEMQGV